MKTKINIFLAILCMVTMFSCKKKEITPNNSNIEAEFNAMSNADVIYISKQGVVSTTLNAQSPWRVEYAHKVGTLYYNNVKHSEVMITPGRSSFYPILRYKVNGDVYTWNDTTKATNSEFGSIRLNDSTFADSRYLLSTGFTDIGDPSFIPGYNKGRLYMATTVENDSLLHQNHYGFRSFDLQNGNDEVLAFYYNSKTLKKSTKYKDPIFPLVMLLYTAMSELKT